MKLVWDKTGERLYETGVDRGVLFPITAGAYEKGVAWNGLSAVNDSPSGAEANAVYADNIKYLNLMSAEEFTATIEAYMYPPEFKKCLGEQELYSGITISQQNRQHFGLCYRTLIGNDEEGADHGYKIHLIFDCTASPSEKNYSSVNDTPEAIAFSWEVSTTPVTVEGHKPTATLVLDSTEFRKAGLVNVLKAIEDVLYGTSSTVAKLPLPDEFNAIYEQHMYLRDSNGEAILDSTGNQIRSMVYE